MATPGSRAVTPSSGDIVILYLGKIKQTLQRKLPWIDGYVTLGLLLALVFFGSTCLVSILEAIWLGKPLDAFIKDIAAPIHFGLLNPLALVLILIYYELLSNVLRNVHATVVVEETDKSRFDGETINIIRLYSHRSIWLLSLVVSVAGTGVFFYWRSQKNIPYYFADRPFSYSGLVTGMWAVLVTYAITVWTLKSWISVRLLHHIFSRGIRYRLNHADGRGGLDHVGALFTNMASIIVVVGLTLSMFWLPLLLKAKANLSLFDAPLPAVLAFISLYLFFMTLIPYGAPLWLIHQNMKERKGDALREFAPQAGARDIKSLQEFYRFAEELPEWPIRMITVSTLISGVLTSIIVPLLVDALKPK
jgi:hypothetical protein